MTMIRYNIQTGANGSVLIPTTPFADGEEIEVVLRERHGECKEKLLVRSESNDKTSEQNFNAFCEELAMPSADDWCPEPGVVRQFFDSRKFAVDITDEEIEALKRERRMRKMQ